MQEDDTFWIMKRGGKELWQVVEVATGCPSPCIYAPATWQHKSSHAEVRSVSPCLKSKLTMWVGLANVHWSTQHDRGVKGTCPSGLNLLQHLESWDHHKNEPKLGCWGIQGHEEENQGTPAANLPTCGHRSRDIQEWPAPSLTCQLTTDTSMSPATGPGSAQNCPQKRGKLSSIGGSLLLSTSLLIHSPHENSSAPAYHLSWLFESLFFSVQGWELTCLPSFRKDWRATSQSPILWKHSPSDTWIPVNPSSAQSMLTDNNTPSSDPWDLISGLKDALYHKGTKDPLALPELTAPAMTPVKMRGLCIWDLLTGVENEKERDPSWLLASQATPRMAWVWLALMQQGTNKPEFKNTPKNWNQSFFFFSMPHVTEWG